MIWLRRLASQWRWVLVASRRVESAPQMRRALFHRHRMGPCRYVAPYWYSRCISYEGCTFRMSC